MFTNLHTLNLQSVPTSVRMNVIKAVREILGIPLLDARNLVDKEQELLFRKPPDEVLRVMQSLSKAGAILNILNEYGVKISPQQLLSAVKHMPKGPNILPQSPLPPQLPPIIPKPLPPAPPPPPKDSFDAALDMIRELRQLGQKHPKLAKATRESMFRLLDAATSS